MTFLKSCYCKKTPFDKSDFNDILTMTVLDVFKRFQIICYMCTLLFNASDTTILFIDPIAKLALAGLITCANQWPFYLAISITKLY